ncbi:MAG TPA: CSLREA domain-containing protein, partial [Longimicrobiaceae bacterium]|nr:CSLREA domain-containing protein [Longimicrobiaceae bacterium]
MELVPGPAHSGPQAAHVSGTTITVTTTSDDVAADGNCSLREAIEAANTNTAVNECPAGSSTDTDGIHFDIPNPGVHTIQQTGLSYSLGSNLVIDGYTQPEASPATSTAPATILIEIDGSALDATSTNSAFRIPIRASNVTVRGLAIKNFTGSDQGAAFLIESEDDPDGGHVIEGNYIGLNAAGNTAEGNDWGIIISNSDINALTTIGGSTPAARNVISGNFNAGIRIICIADCPHAIQGNYIGTDALGTAALPNGSHGISIRPDASSILIGGSAAARNVISGNLGVGIDLAGGLNTVQGNYIGIDATGTAPLGNGSSGIGASFSNIIGGSSAELRNVISANGSAGLGVSGGGNVIEGNYIGTDASG